MPAQVSADGSKLFVAVGSASNVGPEAPTSGRACIFEVGIDGSNPRIWASGIRNPVGLKLHPVSRELYTSCNERDMLGDDLVPDYFTHVEENAFYGFPYTYLAPQNLDPRRTRADGTSENPQAGLTLLKKKRPGTPPE